MVKRFSDAVGMVVAKDEIECLGLVEKTSRDHLAENSNKTFHFPPRTRFRCNEIFQRACRVAVTVGDDTHLTICSAENAYPKFFPHGCWHNRCLIEVVKLFSPQAVRFYLEAPFSFQRTLP